MLNCSAGPTEPWPAHCGGSGDSIAHLYVWPLSCCLPQSLDSDCAWKAQSRASWSWPWRSWQQETIYQPRSLQLGSKSLPDGDLGGASPCPPHQHCVPQGTSMMGMETCRSCCRRCSHSDTWKGTSRRDPVKMPGELPTNRCCHLRVTGCLRDTRISKNYIKGLLALGYLRTVLIPK